MKTNFLFYPAKKHLSKTEKRLLSLLTASSIEKKDVLDFLKSYDIDNEKASDTFLINELLDRFSLSTSDDPGIPRIKGVKEFYRFHNINALQAIPELSEIYDVDLFLRITNKDTVRPFTSDDVFFDKKQFYAFFGKAYAGKYTASLREIKSSNKTLLLPEEKYLTDMLYVRIYYSLIYKEKAFNYTCYLYDILRYTRKKAPGISVYFFIIRRSIRHFMGNLLRIFLRNNKEEKALE